MNKSTDDTEVHARDCRARLVNKEVILALPKERGSERRKKERKFAQETPESIKTKKEKKRQNSIGTDATMKLDTSP